MGGGEEIGDGPDLSFFDDIRFFLKLIDHQVTTIFFSNSAIFVGCSNSKICGDSSTNPAKFSVLSLSFHV